MVPTNVLTQLRIADSRFCFCSFWEYSTNCAHLLCFVGADDSVRPVRFFTCVCRGRCGHRPLQHAVQNRNRPSIPEMSRTEIDAVCLQLRVVHSSALKTIGMVAILRPNRALKNSRASARNITRLKRLFSPHSFLARQKRMGPRSDSCGVTVFNGTLVQTGNVGRTESSALRCAA